MFIVTVDVKAANDIYFACQIINTARLTFAPLYLPLNHRFQKKRFRRVGISRLQGDDGHSNIFWCGATCCPALSRSPSRIHLHTHAATTTYVITVTDGRAILPGRASSCPLPLWYVITYTSRAGAENHLESLLSDREKSTWSTKMHAWMTLLR